MWNNRGHTYIYFLCAAQGNPQLDNRPGGPGPAGNQWLASLESDL